MSDKELSDKQKAFLEALFGPADGDAKVAKDMAGYAPTTSAWQVMKGLENEIMEYSRKKLSTSTAKAVFTLVEVMEEDMVLGAKERTAAAKDILDRAGLKARDVVEIKAAEPIFILPAKKGEED